MKALIYLLQVSACTAIFYLFYRLLLSRLTFFTINRWYLLATVFLSFVIPVLTIPINPQQQHIAIVQQAVYVNTLQAVPVNTSDIQYTAKVAKPIDWMLLLSIIYFTALTGSTFHLLITLRILFKRLKGEQLTKVGCVNILRGNKKLNNGSFFNYIFLNDQKLSAAEIQQIVSHEMLHVKLYHSADRLFVKLAQIILWFNPFIYFYAKSIEENHEFEVDSAMSNLTDKKVYADLLLHLSVANQGMLYHSFSKIPLKKRITMLFNKPSAKMKKVVYVLVLPVALISCLAFARLKSDFKPIGNQNKSRHKLSFHDSLQSSARKNYGDKNSMYKGLAIQTDTVRYQQKIKRSTQQIKGKAEFDAYRQSDDWKRKEKLARDVQGKTIIVKIKEIVDTGGVKNLNILNTGNHRTQGFTVTYKGNDYFMRTDYGQEKQLNTLLKVGDEITMKVFGGAFGKNSPVIIEPAFIIKNNVKIFQLAEADKIPDYPFLYEANKVRFADGQITHIQKYPNGKLKSAVLEIVNGYKFTLNFKPTAPNFNGIEEYDHVHFRFVHEVKTGAKTYQINDWVSISNNIKDYGIKNPDFFYKFYEPTKAQNQNAERSFKVTSLTYQVSKKMLTTLKKDQNNSYLVVGKTINVNTLKNEQERIFKFLAAQFPQIEKSNIVFNVDTTQQKGFCTIKTVIKPLT